MAVCIINTIIIYRLSTSAWFGRAIEIRPCLANCNLLRVCNARRIGLYTASFASHFGQRVQFKAAFAS